MSTVKPALPQSGGRRTFREWFAVPKNQKRVVIFTFAVIPVFLLIMFTYSP